MSVSCFFLFFFLPSFAFPAGTLAADAPACWVPSSLSLESWGSLPGAAGQREQERSSTTPDRAGTGGVIIQKGHFRGASKGELVPHGAPPSRPCLRAPKWPLRPSVPSSSLLRDEQSLGRPPPLSANYNSQHAPRGSSRAPSAASTTLPGRPRWRLPISVLRVRWCERVGLASAGASEEEAARRKRRR